MYCKTIAAASSKRSSNSSKKLPCKYASSHELDLYLMKCGDVATNRGDGTEPLFTSRIKNDLSIGVGNNSVSVHGHKRCLTYASFDNDNDQRSSERSNLNNKMDHLMVRLENEAKLRSQKYRQMQQCLDIEMDIDEHTDYLNNMASRDQDLTESYLLEYDEETYNDYSSTTFGDGEQEENQNPALMQQLPSSKLAQKLNASQNRSSFSHNTSRRMPVNNTHQPSVHAKKKVLFFNDRTFIREQSQSQTPDQSQDFSQRTNTNASTSVRSAGASMGGGSNRAASGHKCPASDSRRGQSTSASTIPMAQRGADESRSSNSTTNTAISRSSPPPPPPRPLYRYKESIVDSTYLLGSDGESDNESFNVFTVGSKTSFGLSKHSQNHDREYECERELNPESVSDLDVDDVSENVEFDSVEHYHQLDGKHSNSLLSFDPSLKNSFSAPHTASAAAAAVPAMMSPAPIDRSATRNRKVHGSQSSTVVSGGGIGIAMDEDDVVSASPLPSASTSVSRASIEADTRDLQKQLAAAATRQQQTSDRLKTLLRSLHSAD